MDITIKPTLKQHSAWQAWNDTTTDDIVYGGAAGGGKSWFGCEALTINALQWPGTRYFIGRKELKTLMLTSYITLTQKVFPKFGLIQNYHWKFDGKYSTIYLRKHGEYKCDKGCPKHPEGKQRHAAAAWSTILLLDLAPAPSDPNYDRLGSHEYTRGWIEEASEIEFRAYDVLKSRIGRHMNAELGIKSKLLITLNPSQDWPYRVFYDVWKKAGRPLTTLVSHKSVLDGVTVERTFIFIQAFYSDNPYTALEYQKNLASISDPVLKQRLAQGDWEYSSARDTLFDAQTIADLFTNNLEHTNEIFMTVDVARYGGDLIVRTIWRGWDAIRVATSDKQSLTTTADMVRSDIDAYGIPRSNVLVDEDGIGGAIMDMVPGIIGFNGGASPFGKVGEEGKETKENYDNLRAQCVYHLSEMARARKVAVSEENLAVRELISQDLQQFKRRDADKDGKLKVSKKEDMKQALGRSPDCGDTLFMRSYFDVRQREAALAGDGEMHVYIPEDY